MADSIRIRMDGLEELQAKLRSMGARAASEVRDAENATGIAVRARAIKSIQRGPASGKIYGVIAGRRGAPHQASKEGEFPQSDTGTLASSIKWERSGADVFVGTAIEYGKFLELKPSSRGGREWLRPSVEAELPQFRRRLVDAIRRLSRGR